MIYLKSSEGQHIIILEPGNLDALKNGGLEHTPNRSVLIAYTPDVAWLSEQLIANIETLSPTVLSRLIEESQSRAEVKDRAAPPDFAHDHWRAAPRRPGMIAMAQKPHERKR